MRIGLQAKWQGVPTVDDQISEIPGLLTSTQSASFIQQCEWLAHICSQLEEKEMEVSLRAKCIPTLIQLKSNLLLIQMSDNWLWIALLPSSLTAVKKCHGGIMTPPRPAWSTWEGPAYGLEVIVTQVHLTLCHPGTVAHQAPLSMEFSRQENWSR